MNSSTNTAITELAQLKETFEIPETFTAEKRERLFQETLLLYDLADKVMESVVQTTDTPNRDKLVKIATPYVTQLRCSTDILIGHYNEAVFKGSPITREMQDTNETAIRNIFLALRDVLDQVQEYFIPPDEIDPRATTIIDVVTLDLSETRD